MSDLKRIKCGLDNTGHGYRYHHFRSERENATTKKVLDDKSSLTPCVPLLAPVSYPHLVRLLGLGGGDHPDQGPVSVVAEGAVHQELVPGAAHPLPLRVSLPDTSVMMHCLDGVLIIPVHRVVCRIFVLDYFISRGLNLLDQRVCAHAGADIPGTCKSLVRGAQDD